VALFYVFDLLHKSNLKASLEVNRVFLCVARYWTIGTRPVSLWNVWFAMSSSTKLATISASQMRIWKRWKH
jgi:hypothetical protein